ncbi:ABC transporter permease [Bacteroidota bacterium]
MLRSFLVITLRILWRNKVTSFINIFSLTIGITAFILIMLYVHHEMSYDKFNENYDRIYRLEGDDYGRLPPTIGDYVKDKVPEVENIARLALGWGGRGFVTYSPADNPDDKKEIEVNLFFADSTTFDVFTFPFIQGDPGSALKDPFTVVLTESTASKLFGDKNPIGETVENRNIQYRVTGIIKDVKDSHVNIDVLNSFESISQIYPEKNLNDAARNTWLWNATYFLITDKADPNLVEEKINDVLAEINDGNLINIVFNNFHICPLKDVYFKGAITNLDYSKHGNLKLVQSFIVIAILILALACINYINLTTARATLRIKEVAMKKVVGSTKALLRYQFITESIMVTLISFLLAFTLIQGLMPQFNQLAMVNIKMAELNTPVVWFLSILGVLLIGIISGLYPAIYLTTIKSIALIKGESIKGSKGSILRRALLTFQFSISILLIIGIITNLRQLHYAKTLDLGFNKEQIIRIATPWVPERHTIRETIKERLLQNPTVLKVSFTAGRFGTELIPAPNMEIGGSKRSFEYMTIDPDYLDMMGIEIAEGRGFSWDMEGDRFPSEKWGVICNETAAKQFWIESPVGEIINYADDELGSQNLEIIGVARDFHYRSLHHKIEPMIFLWGPPMGDMNIKILPTDIPATIKLIENEWKNVYGSARFAYTFLDENFDQQYKSDEQGAKIIGYFTVLAIIIACMGLFALSSFMAVRRTKEIGIRKVMGASAQSIFLLLSQEFVKWVLISVIIACPIAWYVMNRWLQGFAYKINLGVDIFILAAVIALVIALSTVTWQSLKTALANPVNALRYE